jgi:DNA-binding transcriptional LysR family regulator
MNTSMFSTLVAIVDRGTLAAAAQQVGCTPSAVSLQVKQLEAYFGQPLFDRSTRSVKPTPFGEQVATVARELVQQLNGLRAKPATSVAGRLRLGAIASVQADVLPQALRTLRDRHPALDVVMTLNDSDELLSDLKAGRIDAAVLVRPASGGSSRLAWYDLTRQPFVMLAPGSAPEEKPAELLQSLGWIRYDPALTGGRIAARHVRRLAPRARATMDLKSIDAIVAMVAAGLGVTVVPRPRQPLISAYAVRELRLGRNAPTRQIALVCRNVDPRDRRIAAVRGALSEAYARNETTP